MTDKDDNQRSALLNAAPKLLRHNVRLNNIRYVQIDRLKGYDRKLRKKSDRTRAELAASVSRFGIVVPILIDEGNIIIDGASIVEAAHALGYTEVPVLQIEHLDESEVRLLRIALNRLPQLSDWDNVELAAELTDLLSIDLDLDFSGIGFDTVEVDNLTHMPTDAEEDPDDLPVEVGEPGSAISQLGDVWEMGEHRAMCGSSLEPDNVATVMDGELAQQIVTDQPYNVRVDGHVSGNGRHKHREFAQASGEMSEAEFIDFLTKSLAALTKYCVDGALVYTFIDWRHLWELLSAIRANRLTMINLATWVKRSGGMGSLYRSQHELCLISRKGKKGHRNNVQLGRHGRNRTNVWSYPGVNSFGAGRDEQLAMHSTCKNVTMLADAIRDVTDRGDIVLDGFLGSGSLVVAAERTGRRCRGIEIDPLYMDTIVRRWERCTSREAILRSTGETFAQVAERRSAEVASPEIVARKRTRTIA